MFDSGHAYQKLLDQIAEMKHALKMAENRLSYTLKNCSDVVGGLDMRDTLSAYLCVRDTLKKYFPYDIEAHIYFLPEARKTPVISGYRPQFFYDNHNWDIELSFNKEDEWVHPGEAVTALGVFMSPDQHRGKIFEGMPFELREGQKVVARGVIRKIWL